MKRKRNSYFLKELNRLKDRSSHFHSKISITGIFHLSILSTYIAVKDTGTLQDTGTMDLKKQCVVDPDPWL
jgi:hypothetical protein